MTRNQFRWILLKQALMQRKAKTILILLAVTMGASVVASLLNLQLDLRYRMNRELRDYGPNVVVTPASGIRSLPESFVSDVRGSSLSAGILAFTPQIFLPVKIGSVPAILIGSDLAALRKLYPSQEWQIQKSEAEAVFIGVRLAKKIRALKAEKLTIEYSGKEFSLRVGGFVESGESEDDQAFVSLPVAQRMHGSSDYHSILFSVLGELHDVEKEFQALVKNKPSITYQVIRKIAAAESAILEKISRLMGFVILLIFVILFFCIQTTVSAILMSRQAEIALMRVLGARRRQITGSLTLELLLLGMIGGSLGYMTGIVMAQVLGKVLFQAFILPHFSVFAITIVFSLFLMIISSVLPISRAVNRQAAITLKEA